MVKYSAAIMISLTTILVLIPLLPIGLRTVNITTCIASPVPAASIFNFTRFSERIAAPIAVVKNLNGTARHKNFKIDMASWY
ncbi:hypothetical protein D3C76_1552000 [compost metagenome]